MDQDLPHPEGSRLLVCDACWEEHASEFDRAGDWIVTARCDRCGTYGNPREFSEVALGGRKGAYSGMCQACAKAMTTSPRGAPGQKVTDGAATARRLVLLLLGEIALVSPSLQLSKPVRETIYLSFLSRGGDAFIPAKVVVAILPSNGSELGQLLCRIFRLLLHHKSCGSTPSGSSSTISSCGSTPNTSARRRTVSGRKVLSGCLSMRLMVSVTTPASWASSRWLRRRERRSSLTRLPSIRAPASSVIPPYSVAISFLAD